MLLKIQKLIVENTGYKRNIYVKTFYINTNNIISITDYSGAQDFLLTEDSRLSNSNFSLVKVDQGGSTEEVIALGTADEIYGSFVDTGKKGLLNG